MVTIRSARIEDVPRVVELIKEFALFEKLDHVCEVDERGVEEAFFGDHSQFRCLLSFVDDRCVGYAIFYPVFKTFRGIRSMFLEDLFVIPDCRGEGVGIALVKAVAREAAEAGIERLDWQVLKWNTVAAEFYKAFGAEHDEENFDFRITGQAFKNLLK